jgi:uncharacterized membrane protein HdeD (DUF308 family)
MNGRAVGLDDPADEVREVTRLWWLLLLGGAASLVIWVLLLVWSGRTLEVVAILVGIELLLVGALQVGLAVGQPQGSRTGPLLEGVLAGIAGLVVIRHPAGSVLVVALAIGICLLVSGVVGLVAAFDARAGRGWLLPGAGVNLAVGVVIVAWPKFGVTSLAVLLGIYLIVRGLLEGVSALALRAANKSLGAS